MDIYKILDELKDNLKLNVKYIEKEIELDSYLKNLETYLIISKIKKKGHENQIILKDFPIKINKLLEKINLAILKINFNLKSNIKIKKYLLNLNSREIFCNEKKIKLTEQEIKILVYLDKSKKTVNVGKLQKDIWGYGSNLETHTVETHIHRLRKKFLNIFKDDNFIKSSKEGYSIH